jgi:Predicted sugar kinase
MKVAKYTALQMDVMKSTSQHLEDLIRKFEVSKTRHEVKCHNILTSMKLYGLDFDFKPLSELNSRIKDYDLVVTLGGDGTFLRAASFILDGTPIMGINTDSERSHCFFASYNPRVYLIDPKMIWSKISEKEYTIIKRTRIQIVFHRPTAEGEKLEPWEGVYALNEILYADLDVGKSSYFRLSVDDKEFVPYKSSGILVSTGRNNS